MINIEEYKKAEQHRLDIEMQTALIYNKNEKRIFNEKNPEGYYSEGYYDIRLGRYYDDNSPDLRIKSDFIKAVLNVDKLRKLLTQDKIDQLYLDINN